jgi:spermidine synthase
MPEPIRFGERIAAGVFTSYEGELVHRERSPYQTIEVYENETFGRMLMLDGLAQTSERDELFYHEMLVHVPLLIHPEPKRVLIVGGGDGGALRRVLEHQTVQRAVMVEIDERVTEVAREWLAGISAGAFDDPRADVRFADGAAFVRETDESFDVVIVDSSDPIGPGVVLFTTEFYGAVKERLTSGGLLCAQSGSPLFQRDELHRQHAEAIATFADVRLYVGAVPIYPGTLWSYLVAGDRVVVDGADASSRAQARSLACRYWTAEVHAAAFALPPVVRDVLEPEGQPGPWHS